MKKIKILSVIILSVLYTSISYTANNIVYEKNNLIPEGYWIQVNEENGPFKGIPEGIIHTYFAKNNTYGNKDTLQMEIVLPLMAVINDKPSKPNNHCNKCSNGSYNGFHYKGKNALLQKFVFAGNMQKEKDTEESNVKGPIYKNGGVINPNDGKVYSSEAQVQDYGQTMYVKATYIIWNKYLGSKSAHWIRISESDYKKIKSDCDLTNSGHYKNKDKKITSQCTNYPLSQLKIKSHI